MTSRNIPVRRGLVLLTLGLLTAVDLWIRPLSGIVLPQTYTRDHLINVAIEEEKSDADALKVKSNAKSAKDGAIHESPLPPIRGKVPVCATAQNDCVKPYYKPEKVECLQSTKRPTVDSSGAWILPPKYMYYFDQSFANAVIDRVISGSVLELGAGLGCYTTYFHGSGKISKITGYEGAANVESISQGLIKQADLTKKQNFGYDSYDWVVCMEVAEHIPKEFENTLLVNIVTRAKKGVLLTWGVPGQGGVGHVNLRSNDYVIGIMKGVGFDFDEETSNYLRSKSQFGWFKMTAMVFKNTMNVN